MKPLWSQLSGFLTGFMAEHANPGTVTLLVPQRSAGSEPYEVDETAPVSYDLDAIVGAAQGDGTSKYPDGSLIETGDLMMIVRPPAVAPEAGMFVTVDGKKYGVQVATPIPPNGTAIAWRILAKAS